MAAPMPTTAYPERARVLQRKPLSSDLPSRNLTTCEVTAHGRSATTLPVRRIGAGLCDLGLESAEELGC